ncbi:MAG TPA: hypothetical protein VHX86_10490 [Tepidisphaeraceae bacterium]|jgi:hypothetical protein|nr:hypothetical protein [Tepidisphaeraceae bacterium]
MKKRYLGDVLDFYKRWFLREACSSALSELRVLPMFTEAWLPEEIDVYASILGVSRGDIRSQSVPNQRDRGDYFTLGSADVFIDPDTGLRILHERPSKGRRDQRPQWSEFLFLPELRHLLLEHSDRIVVVYDQSIGRGSEREHVETKLRSMAPYLSVAYAAQAGMFALGQEAAKARLVALRDLMVARTDVEKRRLMYNF